MTCLDIDKPLPCHPSPCGQNSQCRDINSQAVCSCLPGFIGFPPTCRPECSINSDCVPTMACINQKCIDPCPGSCAVNAVCKVVNHNAVCVCPNGLTGDPFSRCIPNGKIGIRCNDKIMILINGIYFSAIAVPNEPQREPLDPCVPSPCGLNAKCNVLNGNPSCSCLPEYKGVPPYCRPECTTNDDCSYTLACTNRKCVNPCINACGVQAECSVTLHNANCFCPSGYVGNPFVECHIQQCEFCINTVLYFSFNFTVYTIDR